MTNPVPFRIRELPIVGPWSARIGRTVEIWGMPCNPTIDIWINAFWLTVPALLLAYALPDPVDFLQSRFGRPHHRGRKFEHNINRVITGEPVAPTGLPTWALLRIAKLGFALENVLYIADLTTRGLVQWSSLAYQFAGCVVPGGGGGNQTVTSATTQLGSLSGTILTLPTSVSGATHCTGAAFTWTCDPAFDWSCSYSVNWSALPGFDNPNPTFYLEDGTGTEVGQVQTSHDVGSGSTSVQGFYRNQGIVRTPNSFSVRYKSSKTFQVDGGYISVAGGPQQDFLRPLFSGRAPPEWRKHIGL